MSDTPKPRLKVSREGLVLIKSFEGFRPHAVRSNGGWAIGYGHTASAREGATVTEPDAELLLQYDLQPVAKALNDLPAALNQHQFDALASFALSVGVERFLSSDVARHLNTGASADAAEALLLTPAPPRVDAGLQRRAAERALFKADPAHPTTLAELLTAPLALFPATPSASVDTRAAALAALLGETGDLAAFPASADAEPEPANWSEPVEPETVVAPTAMAEAAAREAVVQTPLVEPTPDPEPAAAPAPQAAPAEIDATPASVVRHEAPSEAPARFDWSEAWLYIFMGVIGLIACAFSAAAFRWSLLATSADGKSTSLVGFSLALTGIMCVAVSAWNLYAHWRSRG
ncbi:MAG: hypothetical protein EON90_11985 [Brevundimonas sp.]|nr:MAG: hypothetical protein EON90_11985 [Brevundimonas sp.]